MPVSWIYSTSSTGQEIEGSVEVIVVPLPGVDLGGSRGGSVPIPEHQLDVPLDSLQDAPMILFQHRL